MLKLATFNIYWLGNDRFTEMSDPALEPRGEADWLSIARVISKVNADVIVFEEIVSLDELQSVLDLTHDLVGRRYEIHNKQGQVLGTGKPNDQKVVIAYDSEKFDLTAASAISGGQGRLPYGVRLRRKNQAGEILVIGVHFKSGQPAFDDESSAVKRAHQCQHLADWVAGLKADDNQILPKPNAEENIAVLGDFNAISRLEPGQPANWKIIVDSLNALRNAPMNDWSWEIPAADPNGGDRSTSYIERLLIDFIMLSPSLKEKVITPPTIYAFDRDPEITGPATQPLAYRVSDHRPVYVELDL
jgi:endonuclease/exonuclease/phosphatase family metal-dependent hydrolase